MNSRRYIEHPEFAGILTFVDAIFAELNVGLLIYHVVDPSQIETAQLIYANRRASLYTKTDLQERIGMRIFDAFPALLASRTAEQFGEVIATGEGRRIGIIEYQDENIPRARFATKAFPMPRQCFGVIFEKMTREEEAD